MTPEETLEKLARFWETHGDSHPTAPGLLKERAAAIRAVLEELGDQRQELLLRYEADAGVEKLREENEPMTSEERARRWLERYGKYGTDIDRAGPPQAMVAWLAPEFDVVQEEAKQRIKELEALLRDILEDSHGNGPINRGLNSIQAAEQALARP